MSIPNWDSPSSDLRTMPRVALWLLQAVGEGNVFTKNQLRAAFPGIAQVDRRMRDLRKYGWVIHPNTSDASLAPDEQRFVQAGAAVWEPEARRDAASEAVTARERLDTLATDDYQCVLCGIAGGEAYPEPPADTAVLSVARSEVVGADGGDGRQLLTLCKRCRSGLGADQLTVDLPKLIREVGELDSVDRARLDRWASRGWRAPTALDRVWNSFRRLPAHTRADVLGRL